MKKPLFLLTAALCAVCAVTLAGCNSGKNSGSSTTERLNTQIVTSGDEPAEDCPDDNDCPDCNQGDGCNDSKCGKKRMPRAKHNGNKKPARLIGADDCDEDDCNDGEEREFDEIIPHHRRPRRKHGHGRKIPAPTEPINEVKPKN